MNVVLQQMKNNRDMKKETDVTDFRGSRLHFRERRWKTLLLVVVVFLTFLVLDLQKVSVGDDLGYMYSDTILHAADGKRVESFGDIMNTQITHYTTCNGRFLVHYVVQTLVALVPAWFGSVCNAIMFTLLWYLSLVLACGKRQFTLSRGFAMWVLLWLGLPVPGVTMLSLDAFAVNYLWVATIILLFIIQWIRMLRRAPFLIRNMGSFGRALLEFGLLLFSIIAGSLQESYSLPLIGAMIVAIILERHRMRREGGVMYAGFFIGTLMLLISPGNWVRTGQGGGMFDALGHRMWAMLLEMPQTGICLLAIMMVIAFFVGRKQKEQIMLQGHTEKFLLLIILLSLLLDCVTFTGVRQLFFPSLLAVILAMRVGIRTLADKPVARRVVLIVAIVGGCFTFAGAYWVREETIDRMRLVEREVAAGKKVITIDCSTALYNYHPLIETMFSRYDDDPFEGKYLQLIFDRYTKQGLVRQRDGKAGDFTVVPCSIRRLKEVARQAERNGNVVVPARIDRRYGAFVVENDKWEPRISRVSGGRVSFERVMINDSIYFIVPLRDNAVPLTLYKKRTKPEREVLE